MVLARSRVGATDGRVIGSCAVVRRPVSGPNPPRTASGSTRVPDHVGGRHDRFRCELYVRPYDRNGDASIAPSAGRRRAVCHERAHAPRPGPKSAPARSDPRKRSSPKGGSVDEDPSDNRCIRLARPRLSPQTLGL